MKFTIGVAKGHYLSGDNPARTSNIYMNDICLTCDKYLDDDATILVAESDEGKVTICEECAYEIHCAYEANL